MEKVLDNILSTGEFHITIDQCVHVTLCYNPVQQSGIYNIGSTLTSLGDITDGNEVQLTRWDMDMVNTFLLKLSYIGDTKYQYFTRVSFSPLHDKLMYNNR